MDVATIDCCGLTRQLGARTMQLQWDGEENGKNENSWVEIKTV